MKALVMICILVSTMLPSVAFGSEYVDDNYRQIGGMVFIPSLIVRDPFITTDVGLAIQYAGGTVTGPHLDIQARRIGTTNYQVAELGSNFELSGRFLPWLSLRLNLNDALYSGINGPSALVAGVSIRAALGGGLTLSWPVGRMWRVGFIADARDQVRVELQPINAVAGSIRAAALDFAGISIITNLLVASGGGVMTFGVARCFAIDLTLEYTFERISRSGVVTIGNDLRAGAVAELDLSQITPVPIGFVTSYRLDNAFQSGGLSRAQTVDLGIYYTGRQNLVTGIDFSGALFELRDPFEGRGIFATLVLKYFWG